MGSKKSYLNSVLRKFQLNRGRKLPGKNDLTSVLCECRILRQLYFFPNTLVTVYRTLTPYVDSLSLLMVEFFWLGNSEVNIPHPRIVARDICFSPEPTWTLWKGETFLPLPGIEPRFHGYSFRSILIILTELSWLLLVVKHI